VSKEILRNAKKKLLFESMIQSHDYIKL